ncbi:hypothetical protein [Dyadobacter arcticus]|uniref:ABC-type proline/glycine betaine transport system permease subunit n=1 Tax=Dyadobacter arcticus TaxID=1078754 RepID=A0ABX0UY41_9BACT|nr:hypothetical protein [Dyadobacter arcticus]NIJ55821.1 ABC-type proline/glycine betaine transport system permease subunit [Dyadobacter arcticus]
MEKLTIKNKVLLLIAGMLVAFIGIDLVLASEKFRALGYVLAFVGVITKFSSIALLILHGKFTKS